MDIPRVENPTNRVIDKFRLRERLMATLMSANPEASCEKTSPVSVCRPQDQLGQGVHPRVGEADMLWGNKRVEESGGLPENADYEEVPDPKVPRQKSRRPREERLLTHRSWTGGQNAGNNAN